ncbi:MAG: hypothetical protein HYT80_10775 [Euryarchaeota archaeon]|nr:hypothetical protein [Euryarchaeota archaeon]
MERRLGRLPFSLAAVATVALAGCTGPQGGALEQEKLNEFYDPEYSSQSFLRSAHCSIVVFLRDACPSVTTDIDRPVCVRLAEVYARCHLNLTWSATSKGATEISLLRVRVKSANLLHERPCARAGTATCRLEGEVPLTAEFADAKATQNLTIEVTAIMQGAPPAQDPTLDAERVVVRYALVSPLRDDPITANLP